MASYYNEIDPFAAQWLRELIKAGLIADGEVDERSIVDVRAYDLRGFTQCHFFAGIGVWSYALRKAGWPDDKPVWTGSCPCQPFSAAGKGAGFADERHLWPAWFHLITTAKPDAVPVFGEQVASKDGLTWLDLVQTDLEGAEHAFGAVDLCAAGVGAPHIRQRLFFVAESLGDTSREGLPERISYGRIQQETLEPFAGEAFECGGDAGRMADTDSEPTGRDSRSTHGTKDSNGEENCNDNRPKNDGGDCRPGPTNGLWADADWLFCRDGKWRPVEPGTFPLVDGAAARVGRLRGYGNAINAEVARLFIRAYMDAVA